MSPPSRRLGASPDDLARLAALFDRAAAALSDSPGRVDRALARSAWTGPAARSFDRTWAADRARLRRAHADCRTAAGMLRRQAVQQQDASQQGRSRRTAAAPLSRSESVLRLGGFVGLGPAEGRASVQARVEELDGTRSRVTVSDAVGAAGVAAVGATVEVGCRTATATPVRPMRAQADVAVGAEVEHRTIWEVPDDAVHPLLASQGAGRLASLVGLGPLAGLVIRSWSPEPAGHELLLRTTASASAVSPRPGKVGPVLSGQAATSVAVGLATSRHAPSRVVVEASGEAAASFQAGFLAAAGARSGRRSTATWARLELPTEGRDGLPFRLELRTTSTSGVVDRLVLHARLSDDAALRAAVERARQDLSAGRTPSQRVVDTLLAGVQGAVADPVVQADRLEAAATGCSVRSVGGAGVRVGGGAGVQVVNLRPAGR